MTTQENNNLSPTLSSKQTKYLRGMGHKLSPLVLVGKEGLSKGILDAVRKELAIHELIKVKIGTNSSVVKTDAAKILPESTESALVQLIGKTLLLYRPNPEKPKEERIFLPKM